jgi:pilus assembly protein CpaC
VTGGEATTGTFNSSSVSSSSATTSIVVGASEDTRTSKIVNLLKISGDDQVTLKVTVAEISRSVMKQLGVNMLASGSANGIGYRALADTYTGLGKVLQNPNPSAIGGAIGGTSLSATINAMEQSGVMKTLAEPTLTAISGEKATFKAGGEYNILTSAEYSEDDAGKGTYSYTHSKIEYGIGLEFLPTVLSPGRISLKVRTSVSEPTSEGSIQNAGANIISIRKRLADTTIELPSGGSMMIAGLVRDDVRQVINGTPGLKNLPILGTLFRSRDFIRNESELVIIVTPYLVRPVARNKLAKPDDNFEAASDGAGNLLGRLNRVYGTMQTNLPQGRYHGVVGFIYK